MLGEDPDESTFDSNEFTFLKHCAIEGATTRDVSFMVDNNQEAWIEDPRVILSEFGDWAASYDFCPPAGFPRKPCNIDDAGAEYWLRAAEWNFWEAGWLFLGIDPRGRYGPEDQTAREEDQIQNILWEIERTEGRSATAGWNHTSRA